MAEDRITHQSVYARGNFLEALVQLEFALDVLFATYFKPEREVMSLFWTGLLQQISFAKKVDLAAKIGEKLGFEDKSYWNELRRANDARNSLAHRPIIAFVPDGPDDREGLHIARRGRWWDDVDGFEPFEVEAVIERGDQALSLRHQIYALVKLANPTEE
jgi:hypothetical protein